MVGENSCKILFYFNFISRREVTPFNIAERSTLTDQSEILHISQLHLIKFIQLDAFIEGHISALTVYLLVPVKAPITEDLCQGERTKENMKCV